ncbi:hypothetical protein AB0N98_08520 [Streptomyces sp. NPDC093681]|uniref:hypothetical protein n=1 Tax=Streptomyces sp. NPDC093681 TaxID=3155202 RepID=UPI003421D823
MSKEHKQEDHTPSSLAELVGKVEVRDISFLELHGRRVDVNASDEDDRRPDPDAESSPNMQVWYRSGESHIGVRCRLDLRTPDAHFVADAAAEFSVDGPLPHDERVKSSFTESVGVPVVYPYIRDAVQNLALKLDVDVPVLSLIAHRLMA